MNFTNYSSDGPISGGTSYPCLDMAYASVGDKVEIAHEEDAVFLKRCGIQPLEEDS